VIEGRTVTTVERLDEERRALEIAEMMRGTQRTERSVEEAREMLEAARIDRAEEPA